MWARLAVLLLAALAPLAQAEACEPCDSYPNGLVPSDAMSLCQKLEGDEMKCYTVQGDGNCGIGELCTGPPVTQEEPLPDCECTGFENGAWYEDTSLCQKSDGKCAPPTDGTCNSDYQKCQGPMSRDDFPACTCKFFANQAWYDADMSFCENENGGCSPSNGGNCGENTLCMGSMTHHDFPVCPCSSPDFRNGAELYDVFSCYESSQGKCAPVQEMREQCTVCKESDACDTSEECIGDDFYSLCRREKRYGCCEAEEACREKDYIQSKICIFDCGADTGLESWRLWRLHDDATGCDTSACDDWLCRRQTRQGCCVAQMECGEYGDYGCFSACCDATGSGMWQCKDMYYECEDQVSTCDSWQCKQEERQKCCLAKEGCDAIDEDDEEGRRACHDRCCGDLGIRDTQCRDMYYECDLSECDGAENEWWCKQEKRQTCCTDKKGCYGLSGDARAECFGGCCEEIGIGEAKCEELYGDGCSVPDTCGEDDMYCVSDRDFDCCLEERCTEGTDAMECFDQCCSEFGGPGCLS